MERAKLIATACARAAHEANRAYNTAIGDPVMGPWEYLDQQQREMYIGGARLALGGADAKEMHESWARALRAQGWRFGAKKDPVTKTHPNLVAYDLLPNNQRAKDELFISVVNAMAKVLGWRP